MAERPTPWGAGIADHLTGRIDRIRRAGPVSLVEITRAEERPERSHRAVLPDEPLLELPKLRPVLIHATRAHHLAEVVDPRGMAGRPAA